MIETAPTKQISIFEGVPTATAPDLRTASTFAVLGASTVTNTGLSILTGDLGLSPGTSITGFSPGIVLGTTYAGGTIPALAQAHVGLAFADLNLQDCTNDLTGQDLGGLTIFPGVNCFDTSAQLTGDLTLDAQDDPNAVFIFRIGSTLISSANSSIILINGATACNTFFAVGSSATLGTNTHFEGNLLALASVTLTTGVSVNGLIAAQTAAVTLDTNVVSTCSPEMPSAALVSITGRVVTSSGRGISGITVSLTDTEGTVRLAITSSFGYYSFTDVEVGQSFLIGVANKRYQFAEPVRVINLDDALSNVNFTANQN